jgi:sec-independent protein translocase protein TatA
MSQTLLLFLPIGGQELLIIALLIFLLFGATRLPQLAKALGQSKKAFREGIEEGEKEPKKEPEKLA